MFSIEQINYVHEKLGKMNSFLSYVTALKSLGVEEYDSYLADGHSRYFGVAGYYVTSEPVHEILRIADNSDKESFLHHLQLHGEGKNQLYGNVAGPGGKWHRKVDSRYQCRNHNLLQQKGESNVDRKNCLKSIRSDGIKIQQYENKKNMGQF